MFDPLISLSIDVVLMVLLVVAIWQARAAQRALRSIRGSQAELSSVVEALNRSITEAQTGVAHLKTVAEQTDENLRAQIRSATTLKDELVMITEAGNSLADRIDAGLAAKKKAAASAGDGEPQTGSAGAMPGGGHAGAPQKQTDTDTGVSEEQRALMEALKSAR